MAKLRLKRRAKKTVDGGDTYSEFEQYEDYGIDDCHEEQNRLLRSVRQLREDKKVWNAANKRAIDDCERNLNHLVAKVEFLEAETTLSFHEFTIDLMAKREEKTKKRLEKAKVKEA